MLKRDLGSPKSGEHIPAVHKVSMVGHHQKWYMHNPLKRSFTTGDKGSFLCQTDSNNSFYSPNYPWNASQDNWTLLLNSSFSGSFPVRCGDTALHSQHRISACKTVEDCKSSQAFHNLSSPFNTQIPEAYNLIFFPRQSVTYLNHLQNFFLPLSL